MGSNPASLVPSKTNTKKEHARTEKRRRGDSQRAASHLQAGEQRLLLAPSPGAPVSSTAGRHVPGLGDAVAAVVPFSKRVQGPHRGGDGAWWSGLHLHACVSTTLATVDFDPLPAQISPCKHSVHAGMARES
jgi:hypothetical protein